MSSPVKGSALAEQIELARESIERWPEWLKEAAGIDRRERVESPTAQKSSRSTAPASIADPAE